MKTHDEEVAKHYEDEVQSNDHPIPAKEESQNQAILFVIVIVLMILLTVGLLWNFLKPSPEDHGLSKSRDHSEELPSRDATFNPRSDFKEPKSAMQRAVKRLTDVSSGAAQNLNLPSQPKEKTREEIWDELRGGKDATFDFSRNNQGQASSSNRYPSNDSNQERPSISRGVELDKDPGSKIARRRALAQSSANTDYDEITPSNITPTVMAHTMHNVQNKILESTFIQANLYTPIETTIEGIAVAFTSMDVTGYFGNTILIPRYSLVIGKYKNSTVHGQARIDIAWKRIIRPTDSEYDSIIELAADSTSADQLGRAGVLGNVDTHFKERFGLELLYSVIGAGATTIDNSSDGDTAQGRYATDLSRSFERTAQRSIRDKDVHDPTLTVPRGTSISIVARNDFVIVDGQIQGLE